MTKGGGIGTKRYGGLMNKGQDKCDVASHGKQCGNALKVTKRNRPPKNVHK